MSDALNTLSGVIEARINTVAATLSPVPTVAFEGNNFVPPTDGAAWIKASILYGDGRTLTAGTGVVGNRVTGVLYLSIFGAPGNGHGALFAISAALRNSFSRAVVSTAVFGAPSGPRIVPGTPDWEQVAVTIPFETPEV